MRTADMVFVTDPKMLPQYEEYNVVESKPVIDFDVGDVRTRDDIYKSEPITLLNVGMFRPVKVQTHLMNAPTDSSRNQTWSIGYASLGKVKANRR